MARPALFLFALLSVGCGNETPECPEGFIASGDWLCLQASANSDHGSSAPVSLDAVLAELPPCTAEAGDGELDMELGCMGEACAGMTYAELVAVFDADPECTFTSYASESFEFESAQCSWEAGVSGTFSAEEGQVVVDSTTTSLRLGMDVTATTDGGVGIDSELSCFIDELGRPETVFYSWRLMGWELLAVGFPTVTIYDYYDNLTGEFGPDGLVEEIVLYSY
ncbi:MAG: hypothetical protein EA397_19460 [Deltaproteobacteria bacterium]|nr:MAG: hypothetical protein EA397_19460 [Deltaproteobacteria bacterium]